MSSTKTPGLRANFRWTFERFSIVIVALATFALAVPVPAGERDDQYLEAFHLIQQADALEKSGDKGRALAKYQKAQAMLQDYRRAYPDYGQKMVGFRLSYTIQKIAELSAKPEAEATNAPQPAPAVTTAATAPPRAQAESSVKLLNAGGEPKKVLRLHPKAGDKQVLGVTMKMAMAIQIANMQNQEMKLPPIKMPMDVTVKSVSPEGDITYETVMGEPSLGQDGGDPQAAAAAATMKTALGSMKGMTGSGTMTSRGGVKSTDMKVPAGAAPQLRQALDQMKESLSQFAVPFPEEAVGPGAKWESTKPIKSSGMTIKQTATYELVSIDGESIVAETTFVQTAANQKIESPAAPGMKFDLNKMSGGGSGELKLNLGQLLPSEASADSHTELSMSMNASGQKQDMSMKLDMNLKIEAQ